MPNTSTKWTASDLPDLSGKTIVVTGANSGIGYEAALEFAKHGAQVILACRNADKAHAAASAIAAAAPNSIAEPMQLDLADLTSIRTFADNLRAKHPALDVLCNNAGVMALPYLRTKDGFEMQFGTNHLGHFALTGLLIESLLKRPAARVVTVASGAHRMGEIRFDDMNLEHGYSPWSAYGRSKLANLLFTLELQRRIEVRGANMLAVACHPGYAATNLQFAGPRASGSWFKESAFTIANTLFAQSAAMGALPTLYAAVSPEVRGADYIGPAGFAEMWGNPKRVGRSRRAQDSSAAGRLWTVSEQMTGVDYHALAV